ncbi:pan domain-containing [Trichoderma arundinaceum]|uniref:Pan domain-containing n=1 Tax=Trichoderma arundinaceum TaxID=490622 RepID=A0A395NZQ4_TRIAR|nr:pan domain-containing [Trichoderma arundinaceum]
MGIQPDHNQAEGRGGDIETGQRGRSATITTSSTSNPDYHNSSSGRRNLTRAAPNGAPMSRDHGWVDEGRPVEQSARTFYREGTPPPPPTRDTNLDVSSTTNILHKAGEFYDYQYDHIAPPAPIPKATICGMKARLFWLVLGAVALLLAIGVGVGVGVGLGSRNQKSSVQPSPTTSLVPHTSSTSVSTSKTTSSAKPLPSNLLGCPQANNTRYQVPGSEKTFLLICGIDFSGADQAVDLGNLFTIDMEDCMSHCATFPGCTACGWGIIPGDPGSEHRCWLKGNLKKTHQTKPGWYFAVLQGNND